MTDGISIWDKLNTVRMIVLLEQEPFSNRYSQILLDAGQYRRVSERVYEEVAKESEEHRAVCTNPNCDGRGFEVGDDTIDMPDLQHITEKKES